MKYKATRTFLKSKELLLATFDARIDAKNFIDKKISSDERNGKKILYRLYDEFELFYEVKNEMVLTLNAEDPEGFESVLLPFKINELSENLIETTIAYFQDKEDAKLFATLKVSTDSSTESKTYLLFKDKVMIDTINKNTIENQLISEKIQDEGNSGNFKPTPLNSRPTPPGGPPDCWDETETE